MRWVGLVRNVMLGREGVHRQVLLDLVEAAGGIDVRSHLTTGNLTFTAPRARAESIGRQVETGLAVLLGREEPVILRDLAWLARTIETNPFADFLVGPFELEVGFLPAHHEPLDPASLPDSTPTVLVHVGERELFTARPRAGGRRPHVVPLLEQATGARATARGWSTLTKIAASGA